MDIHTPLYKSSVSFLIIITLSGCMTSKEHISSGFIKEKEYCELKNFSARYVNGKVYINWIVQSNISNYCFILEKSVNKKPFEVIHVSKGFPSPVQEGLSYSYIDEKLTASSRTYKLRAVQLVKKGDVLLLGANNKNLFGDIEKNEIHVHNNDNAAVNR